LLSSAIRTGEVIIVVTSADDHRQREQDFDQHNSALSV